MSDMDHTRADSCTPFYGDLVSYTLDHDNYDPNKEVRGSLMMLTNGLWD